VDINSRADIDFLKELKILLKNERYSDILLTNVLGTNVTLTFWMGRLTQKPRKRYRLILLYLYFLFIKDIFKYIKSGFSKSNSKDNTILTDKIIIEAQSHESRIKNLWFPVAKKLGKERCLVLTSNDQYTEYESELNYIHLDNIKLNNWLYSRFYILKNAIRWYRKIGRLKLAFPFLNKRFRLEIILILIIQINNIEKVEYFRKKYTPKSYVSIWDWYYLGSAFCSVLKKYRTPTFTFVHGAIGKNSMREFAPLNAQYVFTWGNYSSKLFLERGTPKDCIFSVGIQRIQKFKTKLESEVSKIKSTWKINPDQTIILLAFTSVITDRWKNDIQQLFKLIPDFFFICRPHPSTKLSLINQLIPSDKNNIIILTSKQISLEDCISISDLVIVDSSTAGFDAIIQEKPVFVLDSNEPPKFQDVMLDAIENEAAVLCKNVDELCGQLKNLEIQNGSISVFDKKRSAFVKDYIHAYGNEAVDNVIEILNN
jgi:CDP-Glycerol:Poly(glycerophosphate) glycerophosphotransferase